MTRMEALRLGLTQPTLVLLWFRPALIGSSKKGRTDVWPEPRDLWPLA